MSDDVKWDCDYCTYKNFPASKKCVLCQALRPLQVISDLENSEQDIYKVAELAARNTDNTSSNKDTDNKWACAMCTYLNWSSAQKCAQCLVGRKQTFDVQAGTSAQSTDVTKPLTVKVQSGSSGRKTPTSKVSPVQQSSDINKMMAAYVRNTIKWACKACTYENYPQSVKCAMCGTQRGKVYGSVEGDSSVKESEMENDKNLSLHVDTKNQENIKSGQNSPSSVKYIKNQNDNDLRTRGSSSSSHNSSGESSPMNNRSGKFVSNYNWNIQSGQNSPNNRSSPSSPNSGTAQERHASNSSGQNSPNNQSGQNSPKNVHSGKVSPNENTSVVTSPSNNSQCSPLIARALSDNQNRNRNKHRNDLIIQDGAGAIGGVSEEDRRERRIQKLRKKLNKEDLIWLNACESVVNADMSGIETFLTSGGDPARQLTKDEVFILDRPSAFEIGHTLVHLALRFRRDDMVAILLTATDIGSKGCKRLPSYTCPDLAAEIRREVSVMLRQKKGTFPCYFLTDLATFSLPAEIEDLPRHVQSQLFEEILDSDVDKELADEYIINWSLELTEKLGSRLYALWNRTAGDCLLDSVLQATWGILDIDNTLRHALSDSLLEGAASFYPKWKEYEMAQAHLLNFTLDEEQWQRDWTGLLSLASQPGMSLEQMHIFGLAHILRRPIIVYGVKVVKSFRGESIDFARFEGVYLPLLWERNFCWKTPITLGYTRGHFSALVPMEIDTDIPMGAGAHIDNAVDEQISYLPLVDHEGAFLPIHFVSQSEMGQEETIYRKWLDCLVTAEGLFVAVQKVGKRPPPVKQMTEVWMDYYRHLVGFSTDHSAQSYASDGESDQE